MSKGFWQDIIEKHPKGFSVLAPMEGATDEPFRQVIRHAGRPDVFWTEFTNVSSYASEKGRPNAVMRFSHQNNEQPIVAQIWGTKVDDFETTAKALPSLGYKAIDLNYGCPDKNVCKTGGGSAMIKTPELACEIIKATKTGGLPVSVKTRLGYTRTDEYKDWLTTILQQDIALLTIHLRTRKEMSKVDAHYELLDAVVALRDEVSPETPLIVNGDIKDHQHGMEILEKHKGIQGFMIGRGVFENPFCFEKVAREHGKEELIDLLKLHLDLWEEYNGRYNNSLSFEPLKRFFKIYIRDFAGASDLRAKLMECKNVDEARAVLKNT